MPVLSDYVSGSISLTNGSVNFTGTATGWLLAGFKEGDTIIDITGATEFWGVIATIDANVTGTLTKAWEGPTLVDVAYRMRYQPDGARVSAQARNLIEILGNGNLQALAGLSGSANQVPMFTGPGAMTLVPKTDLISGVDYDVQVDLLPDRAAYDSQVAGFSVLVSDVGDGRAAIYSKVTATIGDWSDAAYVTGPVGPASTVPGITWQGTYSGATAYVLNDGVLYNGSSWRALQATTGNAPPVLPTTINAYWELLARQGIDGAGTVNSVVAGGGISVDDADPTAPVVSIDPLTAVPPLGYVSGLIITNDAGDLEHDLGVSPGQATSDAATPMRMTLASGVIKRLDATFAEGTGNGGFASGESLPTSGTVHIWLIAKADGTTDVMANNSAISGLAPTLPAGFTHKRRIASWTTDASANLDQIIHNGNYFGRKTPAASINATNPGTAAVLRALAVPSGRKFMARISLYTEESTAPGNNGILVSDPAATDVAPSLAAFSIFASILANGVASGVLDVMTDASGQARFRQSRSNANIVMRGTTLGWWDLDRGPAGAGASSNSAEGYTPFTYGAVGNGVTDDSAAFIACQNANSYFRVPRATYALNDVVPILSGKAWFGEDAKLVHNGPTERILEAINKDDWSLLGKLTLQGLGTGIPGATNDGEVGLYVDSGSRWKVGTLHANLFDGTGVIVTGATPGTYHGDAGVIDHLAGYGNYRALDVPAVSGGGSQYLIVNILQLVGNYEAARISAGNVSLGSGNIVHNTRGLELVDGPNDGHGTAALLHINHNADWNIKATDILLGYTFVGCHVFGDSASLGKIILTGCAGITFDGGTFDCAVENSGATYMNVLRNGFFPGTFFSVGGTHPAKIAVSGYTPTAVWS